MTSFEALVGLNMVYDIGSVRLEKMLEFFGKPQDILKAPLGKLTAISGIGETIAAKIIALKPRDIEKEIVAAAKSGTRILTRDDQDYPANLKNIYDPPIVLYVKGRIIPRDSCGIAVVGSRRATYYGLQAAGSFAGDLAERGFTVVSGLARGIDSAAHRGALKAGGRTIAVIGSGFMNIYPEENERLAQDIAKNGAVISEFSLNTLPLRQNFPRRNRVISGLSLGVLVVEAARNSGALITADFALEQGREVFALPGKIDSGTSFGTNALIKQGAKLVSGVEDIIEELDYGFDRFKSAKEKVAMRNRLSDNTQEEKLYGLISDTPAQMDELVEASGMSIPELSGIIFSLQAKKLIRQLPGKQYVLRDRQK